MTEQTIIRDCEYCGNNHAIVCVFGPCEKPATGGHCLTHTQTDERDEPETIVIFRRWRKTVNGLPTNQTVIALFPELPADYAGNEFDSYEHIGQHGAADYSILSRTVPATETDPDVQALKTELETIGYRLRVRLRITQRHDEARREAARKL